MKKNVGNLIQGLSMVSTTLAATDIDLMPVNVTTDSRDVKKGSIFVAIRGGSVDGHRFLLKAQESEAILAVGENIPPPGLKVPYIQVLDSRLALARIASHFYDQPSRSLLMIGVTGTSGKTTTTYLIESILKAANHQVGVIGTVNVRFGTKVLPSTHTTPDAPELQRLMAEMKNQGCTAIVMEVSSHALKQHRTAYIAFDGVIFSNLTPEHLDFHPDMEDYFQSKAVLFTSLGVYSHKEGKTPVGAINRQDPFGERLYQELQRQPPYPEFKPAAVAEEGLQVTLEGISGRLFDIPIQSQLTGSFNCFNIAAAVTLCHALQVSPLAIEQGIRDLSGVPGRLERVKNSKGIHVWVDYAHKPDALEKVLKSLKRMQNDKRIITVFGCGGDRDRKKRPLMGKIAGQNSDQVFVTSDNPRTENPNAIIEEILTGLTGFTNYVVEVDRKKAIFAAIHSAQEGDLVLVAGKGHEDYQILGTQKVHFDDREVVQEAFLSYNSRLDTTF